MTFWTTATCRQKLAQIVGGLECGMTANQISMCLGAPSGGAVKAFAYANGVRLGIGDKQSEGGRIHGRKGGVTGGILVARKSGVPDYEICSAFDVFERDNHSEAFLDDAA